ncbi:MAG: transposase [Xenococcaceae cyanobacterium MO_188.B19]|nr:transposase [Xenococcaceae cyanobacterium MO_188.B19]
MQLVERHKINPNHRFWKQIDTLCFLSKNLYNYCNYQIRQSFIFEKIYLGYNQLYHLVKNTPDYKALPAKVSQQVLKLLDKNWKSFFNANKAYNLNPQKFKSRPKLPKYKDKTKGRNILTYTIQAISKRELRLGIVKLSGTNICLPTKVKNICQARIIPKTGEYVVEIVYHQEESHDVRNKENVAAIDIGINNLCTLTSNKSGFVPVIINGRPLKSLNQYYNKIQASFQSLLPQKQYSSKRIQQLTRKRNNRIDNYLHKASRWIINHLDKQEIGKLIIGHNPGWKQSVNLGTKTNQSFTSIPHSRLIEMIVYKAELLGIEIEIREESYTSKASFLSLDSIPQFGDDVRGSEFSGYRESRGMYKQKGSKTRINADVNGSYNIMRKVIPEIFDRRGIEDVVLKDTASHIVRPVRITPNQN